MKPPASLLTLARLAGVAVACVITVWSMSAGARTLTKRLYVPVPAELTDSCMSVRIDADSAVKSCRVDIRGAMSGIGERPGLSPAYWGIDMIAGSDTLRLTLRHGNSAFGDLLDKRVNMLTLSRGRDVIAEKDVVQFESSSGVFNSLRVEFDRNRRVLSVSGGGKSVVEVFSHNLPKAVIPEQMNVWSRGRLTLASFSIETSLSPQIVYTTQWNVDRLTEYFRNSDDPLEGYWQYLDRENDPVYARPGGSYLLAVVKSDDNDAASITGAGNGTDETVSYDIIYVSGAETYRDQWLPMMLKGRLLSTIFQDHFDLEWIDSTFEPIDRDLHAGVTDGAILTLSFPLLKTKLRFSKMPVK